MAPRCTRQGEESRGKKKKSPAGLVSHFCRGEGRRHKKKGRGREGLSLPSAKFGKDQGKEKGEKERPGRSSVMLVRRAKIGTKKEGKKGKKGKIL